MQSQWRRQHPGQAPSSLATQAGALLLVLGAWIMLEGGLGVRFVHSVRLSKVWCVRVPSFQTVHLSNCMYLVCVFCWDAVAHVLTCKASPHASTFVHTSFIHLVCRPALSFVSVVSQPLTP